MNIWEIPVHPAAAAFAMLSSDELQALAEDIATNGLNNPLIVCRGQLVDGRNRRAALSRAFAAVSRARKKEGRSTIEPV